VRFLRRGEHASTLDLLVAGLGNPGREHARDRHNVGWLVVNGRLAETRVGRHRVALLKPETFMNESGRSVAAATGFFKTPLEQVLVAHDDVDLEAGRLQTRLGGGLAGHNGLRSIAQALGSPEFSRLRIGVGRPARGDPRDLAAYVLSRFEPDEDPEKLVTRAADCVESLLAHGLTVTQQRFN